MHSVWSYWTTLLVASDVGWGNVSFPHSFYILSLVTAILIFFIVSRYIGIYKVERKEYEKTRYVIFFSFGNPFQIKKSPTKNAHKNSDKVADNTSSINMLRFWKFVAVEESIHRVVWRQWHSSVAMSITHTRIWFVLCVKSKQDRVTQCAPD